MRSRMDNYYSSLKCIIYYYPIYYSLIFCSIDKDTCKHEFNHNNSCSNCTYLGIFCIHLMHYNAKYSLFTPLASDK